MNEKEAGKRLRMIETEIVYLEKQIERQKRILDSVYSGRYALKGIILISIASFVGVMIFLSWAYGGVSFRSVVCASFFFILVVVFLLMLVFAFRESAENRAWEIRHGMECWLKYYRKEKERMLSEHPELKYKDIKPYRVHYWEIFQIYAAISAFILLFLSLWYPMMVPSPLPLLFSILVLLITFANYLHQRHFSFCPYEN